MSARRSLTVQSKEVFWNRIKLKSHQVYKIERKIEIIQKAIRKSIQEFQTNNNVWDQHKIKFICFGIIIYVKRNRMHQPQL